MKFSAVFLAFIVSTASADISGSFAYRLIEQSRRLANDYNYQQNNEYTWLQDFSVKYQGCHHIKQWNSEAYGQDDVRIATKRLVRFRLCPSNTCSAADGGGCDSGFGDYIIDMNTFLDMYWQAKKYDEEIGCESYIAQYCGDCENANDDEVCQYECLVNGGMEACVDGQGDNQEQQVQVDQYLYCQIIGNSNNNNGENVQYYAGPYCSEQGGSIKIGVFTDDQCTEFAGSKSFYNITGISMPYTEKSLVENECRSCKTPEAYNAGNRFLANNDNNNKNNNQNYNNQNRNQNNNNQNRNQNNEGNNRQLCETLYPYAGKCESSLSATLGSDNINVKGCTYMSGITMVRSDGMLDVSDARPSAVATAFIVIFAMAFAAMAFYVWYLRTRLGVKKNSFL